jgi:dTDP-glucose pyrophosphorylase/CBS domain-containing protein
MLKNRTIQYNATQLEALKKMDILDKKLLIVLNENKFFGLLSAGDIQRAIIQNKPLETKVADVLRQSIRIAKPDDNFETIRQMMFEFRMELCPVVNENQDVIEVYFWEDVFQEKKPQPKLPFNLPVVIMAGGFGSRLKPLTNVLPKPLIPIGEKTMLEEIFSRFNEHGCNRFYISVNYKAELIKYYIEKQNLPYEMVFFIEDKPMGTAGSLSLLKGEISETFFVSNCDILIEQDYSEILDFHNRNNNEITVIAALKHLHIPYGTIKSGENGQLKSLQEKPDLTFMINSGMYILEPHLLGQIPEDLFFHITQLIECVRSRGGNVGVFPVSEKSWKDYGDWDLLNKQYKKNKEL